MSGPNLSEYFSNNPPSLFDEILKTDDTPSLPGISSMLSKTAPHHNTVDASNYFGSSKSMVPDEVIDFWEPPYTEPGIPPMLTMPGVQLSNDLVISFIRNKLFNGNPLFTKNCLPPVRSNT